MRGYFSICQGIRYNRGIRGLEWAGEIMDNQRSRGITGGSLLGGAAILGAAAVISKLLGTLQKIPLQNMAGDGVFGIYNAVYPLYILILTLATAGIPIAVSKFVSEQMVVGKPLEAKRILKIACTVLSITGLFFFALLYFGAGWIAASIGIAQTETAIKSVAIALLFVPVMAALRGYFQGRQNMVPTAVSQVSEQLVRVITMVALLLIFLHRGTGDEWIAAGATFGSATGAAAGLLIMLAYWWKQQSADRGAAYGTTDRMAQPGLQTTTGETDNSPGEPTLKVVSRFLRYALPICLGSLVVPMLTLVDTFTLPRMLIWRGLAEPQALHEFGLYNHGLPLVQLVTMVAGSMSAALVPIIAQARAKNEWNVIRVRSVLAIRFTWLVGLAASFGLAVTAIPLNIMFYTSPEGWETMAILAFTAVFSTINIVSSAVLQGIGEVKMPAVHLLAGAVVKVLFNLLLIPLWGIQGAAIAAIIAYATASALNLRYLHKRNGITVLTWGSIVRPFGAITAMCAALAAILLLSGWAINLGIPVLPYRLHYTAISLFAVMAGGAVYGIVLFKTNAITRKELALAPSLGRKIEPFLIRFGLIK